MIKSYRMDNLSLEAKRDFLSLPRQIYDKFTRTQNLETESRILDGTHPLSNTWSYEVYLAYEAETVRARGLLCLYDSDPFAYLGFIEAKDTGSLKAVIEDAENSARARGKTKLYAPVDCSFWVGYRARVPDQRKRPFASEPWQDPMYLDVLYEMGYEVEERYYSHHYTAEHIMTLEIPLKFKTRYERALAQGYEFSRGKKRDFNSLIKEIYKLLVPLYVDFPIGKTIREEDFAALISPTLPLMNLDFLQLVRWKGELVGMFLTLPDYGALPYTRSGLSDLLKLLWLKKHSKHYIGLYMAVAKGHEGLGQSMLYPHYQQIKARKAGLTGALIHQGKPTGIYGKELIASHTEYQLLSKKLS